MALGHAAQLFAKYDDRCQFFHLIVERNTSSNKFSPTRLLQLHCRDSKRGMLVVFPSDTHIAESLADISLSAFFSKLVLVVCVSLLFGAIVGG